MLNAVLCVYRRRSKKRLCFGFGGLYSMICEIKHLNDS